MKKYRKEYNNLTVNYEKFTKKCLLYANSTPHPKTVTAKLNSAYVKLKEQSILINPYSSGSFKLRMYFDRTASPKTSIQMDVHDGDIVEELLFHFDVRE